MTDWIHIVTAAVERHEAWLALLTVWNIILTVALFVVLWRRKK